MAERTLELRLIAQDRMTAVFAKAERRLVSFGNTATAVGKKMSALGKSMSLKLTTPILGLGAATLKTAGDFEFGMNKVAALTGATGEDFEKLEKQAKELGRTTMFSARQVSEAMGFMAMAGFETNDILGATPKVLQLAAAGNLDLARAADITTNILTGYGLEVEQLGSANDILAKTFTSTNTNLEQLGEAFKFVGPLAAGMEIPFQDTAAAIGLLGNAGIQASMAGTTLRGALARISQAVTPTGEALNKTGEEIVKLGLNFFDSNGKVKSFTNIVRELEEKGVSAAKIMEIFGLRAGPGMVALVKQGTGAMEELVQKLDEAGGTAQEIADKQMEGFRGQMLKLKSALEGLAIAIADSGLLEFATNLAQKLTELTTRLAESNPNLLRMGTIILGVVAAIGPLLLVLGGVANGLAALSSIISVGSGLLLTKFIPGLAGLALKLGIATTASGALTVSMGFLGAAMASVAGFVVGWKIGTILAERFETVRIAGVALGAALFKMWEMVRLKAELVWTVISNLVTTKLNNIKKVVAQVFSELAQSLQKAFEATGLEILEKQADKLFDIYDKIDDSITENISLQDELADVVEKSVARIQSVEDTAAELFAGLPEKAKQKGTETGIELVAGINEGTVSEIPMVTDNVNTQAENLGIEFDTAFDGFNVGSGIMSDVSEGIAQAQNQLSNAAQTAIEPVKKTFQSFGAQLKKTEVTLPTKKFNRAVASIIQTVGPSVGGVGSAPQRAQGINALQAAQRAALGIFKFANGGIVNRPTLGLVGERGPEAVIPLDRMGGMGGKRVVQNITVNQSGIFTGRPDEMRELAQNLLPFLNREETR